jgi:hypothetical protein
LPRQELWIVLSEMSSKGRVRERLQAGGVISYDVLPSWEVGDRVVITVQALVVAGNLAEVSGRANGGDSAFAGPGDSWGVVTEVFQGGIACLVATAHHVELGQHGRLLKVTVGDVSSGVLGADKVGPYIVRKGKPPVVALACVVEVHATHASTCRVGGPEQGRLLGHQLGQVGWPVAKARS